MYLKKLSSSNELRTNNEVENSEVSYENLLICEQALSDYVIGKNVHIPEREESVRYLLDCVRKILIGNSPNEAFKFNEDKY